MAVHHEHSSRLEPGDTIGEYRIVEVIGNGGFSIVYRAEDTSLLRPVAIKQLTPQAFVEEGTREWFVREARLAASLNHPNIVQTYALREQGDDLFLVMEYLPGGDLHDLIDERGPLDRGTFLRVAGDVCHALETLHVRNVIHRDVKPENILIADAGRFKLADFGLAHIHQAYAQGANDATGPQPGTLLYMSPEQALGREVTPRSDLYSLAVALYEALTGHYYLDFDADAEDDDALMARIAEDEPLAPGAWDPSMPEEAILPLLHALAKDPADRPASARALLGEIRAALAPARRERPSHARHPASRDTWDAPALARELYTIRTLRDAEDRPDEALDRLRPLWDSLREVPEVMAEWGETQLALGHVEEGLRWLEHAVAQKPDLPFAQLALAHLYRHLAGDEDDADGALSAAIKADPGLVYAAVYEDIVLALDNPSDYDDIVAVFERAADDTPTAPVLHTLAEVLALDPAHHTAAVETFEAAIDRDPDYAPPYVGLGSLLLELGDLPQAIEILEQATTRTYPALMPGDWHAAHTVYQRQHAFLALAVAFAQAGHLENSAIAATTVLELDPTELEEDAPDLLEMYAEAARGWIAEGKTLRAYKFLNQAIPLAAYHADDEIFTLLDWAGHQVEPRFRRRRQWDDALDWLAAAAAYLDPVPPR